MSYRWQMELPLPCKFHLHVYYFEISLKNSAKVKRPWPVENLHKWWFIRYGVQAVTNALEACRNLALKNHSSWQLAMPADSARDCFLTKYIYQECDAELVSRDYLLQLSISTKYFPNSTMLCFSAITIIAKDNEPNFETLPLDNENTF